MSRRRGRSRAIRLIPAGVIAALLATVTAIVQAEAASPSAVQNTAPQAQNDGDAQE